MHLAEPKIEVVACNDVAAALAAVAATRPDCQRRRQPSVHHHDAHAEKITLINLKLCLPELSETERIKLARRHFKAYSRSILERAILWWAPLSRLQKLMVVEPHPSFESIYPEPVHSAMPSLCLS